MGKPESGRPWGELNVAPQVIEASRAGPDDLGAVTAGEVIGSQIAVREAAFEHVPDGGQRNRGDEARADEAMRQRLRRLVGGCGERARV